LEVALNRAGDLLAELNHALVDDSAVDAVPFLAPRDNARLGHHSQMLGDVLLRGAKF
jgi:hypothetical protein